MGTLIAKYGDETKGFDTFDTIDPTDLKSLQADLAHLSELLARPAGPARPRGLNRRRMGTPGRLSRRDFLAGSAVVGAAAVAGGTGGLAIATAAEAPPRPAPGTIPGYIPFDGAHQAGIVTPARPQAAALFVAMDLVVASQPELATALAELTKRTRQLTGGLGARCRVTRSIRRRRAGSSDRRSARPI